MKNKITQILSVAVLLLMTPVSAHAAKMSLSPSGGALISGCPQTVNIIVNTEGENTMAADVFLRYNPDEIEIIDQVSSVGGVQIKPGRTYESYPGNIVSGSAIRLTAFNREGFFNGRGVLGSLVFRGKPGATATSLRFDFSPGRSTDSNVADPEATDVLNGVYGADYTFKVGSCPKVLPPTQDVVLSQAETIKSECPACKTCEPCEEPLKGAAPESFGGVDFWPLWVVLAASLIYNLRLMALERGKVKKDYYPVKFEKNSIRRIKRK